MQVAIILVARRDLRYLQRDKFIITKQGRVDNINA